MMPATAAQTAAGQNTGVRILRRHWPEWAVLFLYSALIAFMIPHHEPWADEAQAWMLARSTSLCQLFHVYLHYEGQPGFWHFLLWLLARSGVSYAGMHWVNGGIAVLSMALLLFRSPFPRLLKLSAPFTVFLLYQFPIVARSYMVATLLIFATAACWKRRPMLVAILLGLLANAEAHAFAIAFGFACVYGLEAWRARHERSQGFCNGEYWVAAVLFALFCLAAMLTAWPAHDVYVASYHLPGYRPPNRVISFAVSAVLALSIGLWRWLIISVAGWFCLVAALRARRALRFLIPVATFALFSGAVYLNIWHAGLLVPVILAILWITWPVPGVVASPAEKVMQLAVAVLIAMQICWAAQAYHYDLLNDVSPDQRAAEFLAPYVRAGDLIAVTFVRDTGTQAFHSVGLAPFFSHKLFINQPLPFWWWSRKDTTENSFIPALNRHPQIILVEDYGLDPNGLASEMRTPKIQLIESRGYHFARAFFAHPHLMNFNQIGMCHLIFVANSVSEPAG